MTLIDELQKTGQYNLSFILQEICPTQIQTQIPDPQNLPLLNIPRLSNSPQIQANKAPIIISQRFEIPPFASFDDIFTYNSNILVLINSQTANPVLVIFSQNIPYPLPLKMQFILSSQIKNSDMIFHSNQGVLTLSLKSLVQRQFDFNNSQTASFSNANDILIFGPTILSIRQGVKQGFAQQVLSAKPFGSGCICTVGNQLIYMVESNMIINLPFTGSNLSVNGQFVAIQGDGVFCIYKENNNIIEMENQCRIEIEVRKFNVDSEGKVWFLGQNGQFGVIHQGKVIAVQEGVHDFCLNEEEIVFSVIGQKGVEIQRGYIE